MGHRLDNAIKTVLSARLADLEKHLESDVVFFYGAIQPPIEKFFRDFLERLKRYCQELWIGFLSVSS